MLSTDPHFDITSLGLTLYSDKIPSAVAQPMHVLAQSNVVLVPLDKEAVIGAGRRTDSHLNVKSDREAWWKIGEWLEFG